MSLLDSLQFAFLADPQQQEGPSFLWLAGALVFIWIFLVILPGRKEKHRKSEMLNNLTKGDRVLLQAGCVGKVVTTKDEFVTVDFDGSRIKFLRNTIVQVLDDKGGDSPSSS